MKHFLKFLFASLLWLSLSLPNAGPAEAVILCNNAWFTTATTGTGTITSSGAVSGAQTMLQCGLTDGQVTRYRIFDGADWEVGTGTVGGTSTTLTRGPIESSNADAAISLSGTATVIIAPLTLDLPPGLVEKGTNVASAGTISLGDGSYFHITGTTTITDIDFAEPKDGRCAILVFDAALTLTHNATTLVIPGNANVLTAANDEAIVCQDSGDNIIVTNYQPQATLGATGKKVIWLPGGSLTPRTTAGCAVTDLELATNDIMLRTCNYDPTTEEGAGFTVRMPDTWDEGTLTAVFIWTHPATATNFGVVWQISCLATSNDDAMDATLGTQQEIADTGGTTSDQYTTSATPAITCSGTPQPGDTIYFEVEREPGNGSDTLAVDAFLMGVSIYYNDNAFVEP